MNPQVNFDDQDLDNVPGSKPPSGKPDKKLGTSNLVDLLGTKDESYYIDKSGLVAAFFKCDHNRVLVTGPRHSGKTTNITMLKAFFELQIPVEESKILSKEDFQRRIEETDNYKLFQEHELRITRKSDLMEAHFGQYPVVHISFECVAPIESYDQALAFCMGVISDAFKKYGYLQSCTALSSDEKNVCRKWCNEEWDVKKPKDRLKIYEGLKTLAKYMYKRTEKTVVLVVDEYDSIIRKAMLHLKHTNELKTVIQIYTDMIQAAVKGKSVKNGIKYPFITGILYVLGIGKSDSNRKPFMFLENHPFVPYCRLTDKETKQLLQKTYSFDEEQIADSRKKLHGYSSRKGLY